MVTLLIYNVFVNKREVIKLSERETHFISISELREGGHFGHGIIGTPNSVFPDAPTLNGAVNIALRQAKAVKKATGNPVILTGLQNIADVYKQL